MQTDWRQRDSDDPAHLQSSRTQAQIRFERGPDADVTLPESITIAEYYWSPATKGKNQGSRGTHLANTDSPGALSLFEREFAGDEPGSKGREKLRNNRGRASRRRIHPYSRDFPAGAYLPLPVAIVHCGRGIPASFARFGLPIHQYSKPWSGALVGPPHRRAPTDPRQLGWLPLLLGTLANPALSQQ
jgi:hypothetical protein